ncbi:DUF4105 domain-containing protein [Candidatus Poseidoniaceae archaeon]|nr:DUF4105 domain-containing protein [Candidatus Poseidoniaceae archaeon]|tara:strand:+ start:1253 stop:2185 length:933 start_codon:yes stop_codon:yes gene_type:complete
MVPSIGGIHPSISGSVGDFLQDWILISLIVVGCVIGLMSLHGLWLWWTRVRPKQPRLNADWQSDCEFISSAEFEDSMITFRNVRDFHWRTTRDRDERWADEVKVDSEKVKHIWFVVDQFHSFKGMSHTYLTFEFKDGTCLSFSFEARRVKGKRYHPWTGLWRSYELYLLLGFERDVTQLRTHGRNNIVHMYRVVTPPDKDRQMILQMSHRLNQLTQRPEFYHTLFKTCNTSIVRAVNTVTPGRIPFLWRNFLPGYTPKAALKLGLIEDWGGLEMTREKARVDQRSQTWDEKEEYSEMLRNFLPPSNSDQE